MRQASEFAVIDSHFGANAMATQGSAVAVDISAFSAQLFDQREVLPRARIVAQAVADFLPGTAVALYLLADGDEGQVWAAQTTVGEVTIPESSVSTAEGTLGILAEKGEAQIFPGKDLLREHRPGKFQGAVAKA